MHFTKEQLSAIHAIDIREYSKSKGYVFLSNNQIQVDGEIVEITEKTWRLIEIYPEYMHHEFAGDILQFVQEFEGMKRREAILHLLKYKGIEHQRPSLVERIGQLTKKQKIEDVMQKVYAEADVALEDAEPVGSETHIVKKDTKSVTKKYSSKPKTPVEHDSTDEPVPKQKPVKGKKEVGLLPQNRNNNAILSHLTEEIGIQKKDLQHLIKQGILYEDNAHNCIFAGLDSNNNTEFALRYSIQTKKLGAIHLNKEMFCWCYTPNAGGSLVRVFENPIQALHHIVWARNKGEDWKAFHYIAANGFAVCPILTYLRRVNTDKSITNVVLWTGQDPVVIESAEKVVSDFQKKKGVQQISFAVNSETFTRTEEQK